MKELSEEELSEMKELFEKAMVEFKRADHLLYVSLKYTRTHDVMISLVDRLMATVDRLMNYLYTYEKIEEIPTAPVPKANNLKKIFEDDKIICDIMDLFILMRKVGRGEYETKGEFRRTLNTIVTLPDGDTTILDIDTMQDYYNKVRKFKQHTKEMVFGEED